MADKTTKLKFVLAGNPNCGKSTLFNVITGAKRPVGNFSGVTVELYEGNAKGKLCDGKNISVCDLPGTYSMEPSGADELVAAGKLKAGDYDCIINVVDGTNMARHLALTLQLFALGKPMAIAITMWDQVKRSDTKIDLDGISSALGGVPIVPVNSKTGEGVKELLEKATKSPAPAKKIDVTVSESFSLAERLCAAYIVKEGNFEGKSYILDRVFLNGFWGVITMAVSLALIFLITFGSPGSFVTDRLAGLLDLLGRGIGRYLESIGTAGFIVDLLCDGILAGVFGVLSFIPQLAILYVLTAILEDSGLMARFSFIADPFFRKIGLSGKAAIPFVMSFGCIVPALATAKTADSPRDRFLTLCMLPFISCSARLPIYFYIANKFFGGREFFVTALLYIPGVLAGFLLVKAISCGLSVKGRKGDAIGGDFVPLVLELPPYRVPQLKNVASKTWVQLEHFIKKASTVILLLSVAMWFLRHFSWKLIYVGENTGESLMYLLGKVIAPLFKPLGFGCAEVTISLITGVAAKEAVVSSLLVFEKGGFMIKDCVTRAGAAALLCFAAMYTPCAAAIATLKKELGSGKKTAALLAIQLVIAYIAAGFVFLLFSAIFA